MPALPRLKALDSAPALLLEGYGFVSRRCRRHRTQGFRTRIFGEPVVCMQGRDAAELFYGDGRFTRKRAIPRPTLTLLQDFGSVAVLDGPLHRHRKAMFMELMDPASLRRLSELSRHEWRAAIERWAREDEVVLDSAAQEVLCRVACAWTGVPLEEPEVRRRAHELAWMFDGAGSFGARQLRGQLARRRGEEWIRRVVERLRAGQLQVPDEAPARVIAAHRDPAGAPLDVPTAAVELINLLRPMVAVSRFVTFAALALHRHPRWQERVEGGGEDLEAFVQEVRRTAPFFPLVTGRAAEEAEWHGHRFARGDWALLDIYGTNRDPRSWQRPDDFEPERFLGWAGDPYALIAQGGGDFLGGHRCAGEWATISLMKDAVSALARDVDYDVPPQDLRMAPWRMPAVPRSGLKLARIRPRALT